VRYVEPPVSDAARSGLDGERATFRDALAEVLDQADGLEVDFEPTEQGRRLLASLGVVVKESQ
jgi:hypothetical protein